MPNKFSLSRSSAYRFVVLIGVVSLFSDMTYQGAHGNAGPFLGLLGASGAIVGLVAGGGEMVNYVLRLFSGYWVDRSRRYWQVAFAGYAINLLAVPLLALAGHWPVAAMLFILERAGKGIRTPARDVMLSHAADQVGRGWAFGLHEALDQTGGILGPLLVAGVLFFRKGYSVAFALLGIPAIFALLTLLFTYHSFRDPEKLAGPIQEIKVQGLPRQFWIFLVGIGLLAIGYTDFALMAFHFHRRSILSAAWIPVVYAAAMGLQGVGSLIFGRLFDQIGMRVLMLTTVGAVLFAPLAFLGGPVGVWSGVALWALGMGAQSSVMKAFVAQLVAPGSRGSAYGVLNSIYGLLWFAGSAVMGFLYDRSLIALVLFSVVAQLLSFPFLWKAHREISPDENNPDRGRSSEGKK